MTSAHDHHWTFGKGAHILFPGGGTPIVASLPHAFSSSEGCATVSDPYGNLLFYTDGQRLYDSANIEINPTPQPTLGGTSSSTHSAIVIPPAGIGVLYHIFAVGDWDGAGLNKGPISHTTVAASGGSVAIVNGPAHLAAPKLASERLAAVPHTAAGKYWLVSLGLDVPADGGPKLFAMLVDGDGPPSLSLPQPYPYTPAQHFCVKFSPDGNLIAFASSAGSVDILNFDRATGAFSPHSQIVNCLGNDRPYGVEFSPDGSYLYFTGYLDGYIRRHKIVSAAITTPFSATTLINQFVPSAATQDGYRAGALQLGPNGKIYGAKVSQNSLFEIGDPNHSTNVQFNMVATTTGGLPLVLNGTCLLGLPTFTRIISDRCARLAAEVDELLGSHELHNSMLTCEGEAPVKPQCEPVDIPPLEPQVYIRWGDSKCDCIEGDDTEIMHLTICNPYKNVTLSNLVVSQLVVVDSNGNPVPNLPNGDPSIELVPIGPYCFDDIAPCTCVTREFVLWLRGAPGGTYHIEVKGICFDACFHGDADACFQFEVCKD